MAGASHKNRAIKMQNLERAVRSPRSHKHLRNVYICKCCPAHKPDSKSLLCQQFGSAVQSTRKQQTNKICIHWRESSKLLLFIFKGEGGIAKVWHPDMTFSPQCKKSNRSFSATRDSFLLFSYMQTKYVPEKKKTFSPLSIPGCNWPFVIYSPCLLQTCIVTFEGVGQPTWPTC